MLARMRSHPDGIVVRTGICTQERLVVLLRIVEQKNLIGDSFTLLAA